MSDWISITSELPKEGEEVLISDGMEVRSTYFIPWGNKNPFGVTHVFGPIKYWMKIPELPKNEY